MGPADFSVTGFHFFYSNHQNLENMFVFFVSKPKTRVTSITGVLMPNQYIWRQKRWASITLRMYILFSTIKIDQICFGGKFTLKI